MLQRSAVSPGQNAPPNAGDGLLHSRFLIPVPQVFVQLDQADQAPSTKITLD